MDRSTTFPRICFLGSAALTLIAIICRSIAMLTCFDADVGYLDHSALSATCTILCFVGAIFPVVAARFIPRGALSARWAQYPKNVGALLPMGLFLLVGIMTIAGYGAAENNFYVIPGLTACLAALYYLFSVLPSTASRVSLVGWLGFAVLAYALIAIAETYTDQFTTMNSPVKLTLQLGFLSLLLMTVAELRIRLDKALPRGALCFHCMAMFFCLNGAIPTLIAYMAGAIDEQRHFLYAVALLGTGVYAILRLIPYTFFPTPLEDEAISPSTKDEGNGKSDSGSAPSEEVSSSDGSDM